MKKLFSVLLFLLIVLTACGPRQSELTPIRLTMGFRPDIQFAPLYVALEKGFFADEGFAVELEYMDENQSTALVGANELQFAVVSGEQVLLARAQELPVVYVAAWYQHYPVSVVSKAELGITSPENLRGLTIGLPGLYGANYIGLRGLLHAGGLTEADVTLESIGYTQVEALATDQTPVVSVYTANEPTQLRARGYTLNELRVADYVDLTANGLITNEATLSGNPEMVRRMVNAFLKGVEYAMNHADETYTLCMKYVENLDQADETIQKQVLAASIEIWKAERLGYSNPESWENMEILLLDMGLLTEPQDLSKAFTNEFLP